MTNNDERVVNAAQAVTEAQIALCDVLVSPAGIEAYIDNIKAQRAFIAAFGEGQLIRHGLLSEGKKLEEIPAIMAENLNILKALEGAKQQAAQAMAALFQGATSALLAARAELAQVIKEDGVRTFTRSAVLAYFEEDARRLNH